MKQYLEALNFIMTNGEDRGDRTGIGTRSVFGYTMRFNLQEGFPAMTTKKLAWKSVVSELLWFLEGSDNERRLAEILYGKPASELTDKTTIWTANADKQGVDLGYENNNLVKKLGPVYGVQWRGWEGIGEFHNSMLQDEEPHTYQVYTNRKIDQISQLINDIKNNPESRRHMLSAWNVAAIDKMALPPCHLLAQFYVSKGKYLNCMVNIRSNDMFLGNPFNIASYALLIHMLAQVTNLEAGELIMCLGDAHIYNNHFDQVNEQLKREPLTLPKLWLNPEITNIDNFTMDDIKLEKYQSHDSIKAIMAA